MEIAFLVCALALPVYNKSALHNKFREYIESRVPDYRLVYINPDEKLMMHGAQPTPYMIDGLRVWAIKKAA